MADVTSIYGNPIKDAVARADISTLQTDVQDVKDGLTNKIDLLKEFTYGEDDALADTGYFEKSHNLINPYTVTEFVSLVYNTGATVYNSGRNVSDYIPIDTANKYYVYASVARDICLYDASKSFVEGFSQATNFNTASNAGTLNANDKYIRITYIRSNANQAYFCLKEYSNIIEPYGIKKASVTGAEVLGSNVYNGLDSAIRGEITALYNELQKIRVHIGVGYEYTSITEAVKDYKDVPAIFFVHKGTYDIYSEYKATYGNDYFKNYSGFTQGDYNAGLFLTRGQELIGDPLTKIVFNYDPSDPDDGGNENVSEYFSIISLSDDNTVKNIHFEANGNCRYFIHDDFSDHDDSKQGTNTIENCVFEGLTKSNTNPYIGAGMGLNRGYVYKNNYFDGTIVAIGIHNNKNATKNCLTLEGNYANGDIYIQCWGASAIDSTLCMISNNRYVTMHRIYVDSTMYPNANMKVVQWNNSGTYSDDTV